MRVFNSLDEVRSENFLRGTAVAIGKFDGVHRGHRAILSTVKTVAESHGVDTAVFTFSANPLSLLRPELCPPPLMSVQQRVEELAVEHVDACVMVEFDERLALMPPETFVERVLVGGMGARHAVMGADFRFGHRGVGDSELLRRLGGQYGFEVSVVDEVDDAELGIVSSTRIRSALSEGDVEAATRMLAGPVRVRGKVVHGEARGRQIGFPTANLGGRVEGYVPADGVYAGWAVIGGAAYAAAISVGNNPTFTPRETSRVEAYLLDFDRDVYGESIELRFTCRLRGMITYDGVPELVSQMNADVSLTRHLLTPGKHDHNR